MVRIYRTYTMLALLMGCLLTVTVPVRGQGTFPAAYPEDTTWVSYLNHLDDLPFRETLQEYYDLFPGMVLQNYRGTDYLHFRGSRHDEIGYTLEGADIRSAFTGQVALPLIPEALERITLKSSPSAADANAPVVLQHTLRTGHKGFHMSLRGESDRFTPSYTAQLGTYSYGYENLVATVEGSVLSDRVRFFLAGQKESFDDAIRVFWDGFTLGGPENPLQIYHYIYSDEMRDTLIIKPLKNVAGTDQVEIKPGNIPASSSDRFSLNGSLTAYFGNLQLRGLIVSHQETKQVNNQPIRNIFNTERVPLLDQRSTFMSLQMDHPLPAGWHAHLKLYGYTLGSRFYDPIYGDDFLIAGDTLITDYTDRVSVHGHRFSRPNTTISSGLYWSEDYAKSAELALGIQGHIRKAWQRHQLIIGLRVQRVTLRKYVVDVRRARSRLNYLLSTDGVPDPDQMSESVLLNLRLSMRAYGYDTWGNRISSGDLIDDPPRYPLTRTAFIDHQYHLGKWALRSGLRFVSYHTDALVIPNPEHPPSNPSWPGFYILLDSLSTAPPANYLLPRLSAIYQVKPNLTLGLSYGAHALLPQLQNILASRSFMVRIFGGQNYITNPPGWDAGPARSHQAEVFLLYRPGPAFMLNANLYYKTTADLLDVESITVEDGSSWSDYIKLSNRGRAYARGIELSLMVQPIKSIQVALHHTMARVEGTASHAYSNVHIWESILDTLDLPIRPLHHNQAYRGNVALIYEPQRPALRLLRHISLQALVRYNGGHSFTTYPESGFS